MLDLVDLHKTFARGTVNAQVGLDGLSLHLNKGEFVTILGSNGAGKSTLFNAICGSFQLDGGRVRLDGQDITFLPEHARARQIGRVFQDPMKGTAPGSCPARYPSSGPGTRGRSAGRARAREER